MITDRGHARTVSTPLGQRLGDLARGPVVFVVWVAAAVAAFRMIGMRSPAVAFVGEVRSARCEITAPVAGAITDVRVSLFDRVQAGDVIVVLDEAELDARAATARATIEQLAAAAAAEQARMHAESRQAATDHAAELQRFFDTESRLRLATRSIETEMEADRAEIERLRVQLERTQALATPGVVSRADVDDLLMRRQVFDRRLAARAEALKENQAECAAAESRRKRFEGLVGGIDQPAVLRAFEEQVLVERARLNQIELERRRLIIRTPVTGRITELPVLRGQTVADGQRVACVLGERADGIEAFIPEGEALPDSATKVEIVRRGGRVHASLAARPAMGPQIARLPERLWRDRNRPEFARPVLILPDPELGLVPGEVVHVRFVP